MTGNARGRRLGASLVCCLGISLLTGCSGKKTVEYGIEGNTQSQGVVGGGMEQFEGKLSWEADGWKLKDEKGEKVILEVGGGYDLEIVIPNVEEMFVVQAEEVKFDADYKSRVAKAVFSAANVYNDDEAEQYVGERGGITYLLSFDEKETDEWNCKSREISLAPEDIYQVCPEELRGVEGLYYDGEILEHGDEQAKNQCPISEEAARETAEDFVDGLGFCYPVCSGAKPLAWWKGTSFSSVNANYLAYGYVISYDIGVDGMSFVAAGAQENYGNMGQKKESERPQYNMKARMDVCVTESGVIGMRAYNPAEITEISKGVKFLSLETVKEIIKEQTVKNPQLFRFCLPDHITVGGDMKSLDIFYDRLELIYFRVRDKENEGRYSYVPAWRLSEWCTFRGRLNSFRIDNPIIINAIDGTVINFYEEA